MKKAPSKKLFAGIFSAFLIVFSFQNCSQAPRADEVTYSAELTSMKVDLQSERMKQVDFLIQENESVTRAGRTYSIAVNKTLQVDLITGIFKIASDLGLDPNDYCLTDSLKQELLTILKGSQICKNPDIASDKVCTMVLKPSYAQILTDVDHYDLGSANNGCGAGSVDLCGSQPDMLKGFIAALKNQYKSLSCH